MSQSLAPKVKISPITIKIVKGPHAGENFVFNKGQIAIGRGAENDVVLSKDPKISRQHLQLVLNEKNQILVKKVAGKNLMVVGSAPVESAQIYFNESIAIGDSEVSVEMEGLLPRPGKGALNPVIKNIPPVSAPTGARPLGKGPNYQAQSGAKKEFKPQSARRTGGANSILPIILVGFVILGGLYFYTNKTQDRPTKPRPIQTSEDLKKLALESTQKQLESYKMDRKIKEDGKQDELAVLAQSHFIKGRRDYTNGQYGRAIQAFRDALTFEPSHNLAYKYLNLATRKQDEIVQINMVYGRKYKDRGNYKLCRASYQKVLDIKVNPDEQIHKEAKQMRDLCDTLTKGRY